jgi:hypothetical protein
MSRRTISLSLLLLLVVAIVGVVGDAEASTPIVRSDAESSSQATKTPAVTSMTRPSSSSPTVVIRYGTESQHQRLELALLRFDDAGLVLPDLEVVFSSYSHECKGHYGLFDPTGQPWRISICSDLDAVYEHELAHAWAAANLTKERRNEFMDLRGYEVWSDSDVSWNKRGTEGAAFIIQQGLGGLPLPPVLSGEHLSRLAGFELLTGVPDPRLALWTAKHHADEPR